MKRLVIALWLGLAIQPASACGPDFDLMLLDDRAGTLDRLPEGFFAFEVRRMQPLNAESLPQQTVAHDAWFWPDEANPISDAQREFEQQGYSTLQKAEHDFARLASNAEQAYSGASSLPPVHRHYIAGAVAFRKGDWDAAKAQFSQAVELAKPTEDWRLSALYMLGRIALQEGNQAQALAHFAELRAQALKSQRDPLGLATAALGERALVDWKVAKDPNNPSAEREAALLRAMDLYLQQASVSPNGDGVRSLRFVARAMSRDASLLELAIKHPKAQQLIAAYAYARGDSAFYDPSEYDADTPQPDAEPLVARILAAAKRQNMNALAGGDYLAAALYSEGQFASAQAYVEGQNSALAHWVHAKLALRAGKNEAAAKHYALAAERFPRVEEWDATEQFGPQSSPRCRVQGEAGVLALSRSDYMQAATLFFQAAGSYSQDLSQVAERVLTLDELQKFVDQNTKPNPNSTPLAEQVFDRAPYSRAAIASRLRDILARRLMREGQMQKALAYFDFAEVRDSANRYQKALQTANTEAGVRGAQGAYEAALIARRSGMEILGYELSPDFYVYDGVFSTDYEQPPQPEQVPLLSKDELGRLQQSIAKPNQRYHYRYLAADWAEQAADNLPPRSQAYAAVLCQATRWMINLDPERAQRIYRRYLQHGAYVPWGGIFGTGLACPTPDFARAQQQLDAQTWQARKRLFKRMAPYFIGASLLLLGLGILLQRRSKSSRAVQ